MDGRIRNRHLQENNGGEETEAHGVDSRQSVGIESYSRKWVVNSSKSPP